MAGPGESVVSPSVLCILKTKATTSIVSKIIFTSKDGGENSYHKVSWSCPPIAKEILSYFDESDVSSCKRDAQSLINELVHTVHVQSEELDESLKLDVMRLFENHRHEAARDVVGRFTAELRRVAVLFISIKFEPNLPDDPIEDSIVLDKFQSIFSILSDSVSSRAGQIRQFIYDDKGTVFIARYVWVIFVAYHTILLSY